MKYLLFTLLALNSMLFAASNETLTLESEYLNVWRTSDARAAEHILHSNYHYIGADGERHSRLWTIEMIGSGRLVYDNIHIERGPVIEDKDALITLVL